MRLIHAEILEIFRNQQLAKEAIHEKCWEDLEEDSAKGEKLREILRCLLVG
jgi:hypothetical protein